MRKKYSLIKSEIIHFFSNNKNLENLSLFSVVLFVGTWLFLGNTCSLIFSFCTVKISSEISYIFFVLYLLVVIPVILSFFFEILRFKTRLKWVVFSEILLFGLFIIAPPRNADAMRVWLAKAYDVWLHGTKILRPYYHYNTPDAFSFFHAPIVTFWDGQLFQLSIWTALCGTMIILIKIGRIYNSEKGVLIGCILFLFNPIIILGATVIITDIPVILSAAGMLYAIILYEKEKHSLALILLFLFLSFGMNVKYNMLMFTPAILCWLIQKKRVFKVQLNILPLLSLFAGLALLPYIMNYFNIGNPVWPALVDWFPADNSYMDKIANAANTSFLGGERTLPNFMTSFAKLFFMPQYINPLAMVTVFFVFARFRYLGSTPSMIVVTYFFFLFMMMPDFSVDEKQRYVLYLFPVIIPLGVSKIYEILSSFKKSKILMKIFEGSVLVTVLVYASFTVVYSGDLFKYLVTHDKSHWHRATWYYEDYTWINKNIELKPNANILVMVSAQQTYYLRKPYINAGQLSAAVNWCELTDIRSTKNMLETKHIEYIFVDIDECFAADPCAEKAILSVEDKGIIKKVRQSKTKIYTSRIQNQYRETDTILYKVMQK